MQFKGYNIYPEKKEIANKIKKISIASGIIFGLFFAVLYKQQGVGCILLMLIAANCFQYILLGWKACYQHKRYKCHMIIRIVVLFVASLYLVSDIVFSLKYGEGMGLLFYEILAVLVSIRFVLNGMPQNDQIDNG